MEFITLLPGLWGALSDIIYQIGIWKGEKEYLYSEEPGKDYLNQDIKVKLPEVKCRVNNLYT